MIKKIIASGPVIVENEKLLVTPDGKDDFYKIPGGKPKNNENLEQCAIREVKEETGFDVKIIKKLSTLILNKKPGTDEEIRIELNHFAAKINGKYDFSSFEYEGHKVEWIKLSEIKNSKYDVAPNIEFLLDKGELQ